MQFALWIGRLGAVNSESAAVAGMDSYIGIVWFAIALGMLILAKILIPFALLILFGYVREIKLPRHAPRPKETSMKLNEKTGLWE